MAIPISEFWRLLIESRLLSLEQCQHLNAEFSQTKSSTPGDASALASWLISKNAISYYQSKLLLAGRPGPFFYGEYVVYDRVDRGQFAGLFRAVHAGSSHPVLLRFLTSDITDNEPAWQAYAAWINQECGLNHPHLQRCFELVDLADFKYLVLEDLRGRTAAELGAEARFTAPEACRIARQAALALHDLHQTGRVHGDVRPKTIVLESGGHVKLLRDFTSFPGPFPWGMPDPHGVVLDRTNYLAPEMSQTGRAPDPLTDIYALGCTLYELIAGRPPFVGGDMLQTMHLHATARIQPLEEFGAPPQVGQIVAYLMAKNPQLRFQEAANAAEQLAAFVEPAQLHALPPAPAPTLAAFEAHVHQKRNAAEQQRLAARRAAPVGAGTAGRSAAAFPQAPTRGAAGGSKPAPVPDFSAVAKSAPAGPAAASAPARVERRRSEMTPQKLAILLGSAAVMVILILVGLSFLGEDAETDEAPPVVAANTGAKPLPEEKLDEPGSAVDSQDGSSSAPQNATAAGGGKASAAPPAQVVVPDDGATLWASPTNGAPLDLRFSPPGGQMFFAFRPSAILASPNGPEAIQALGPRMEGLIKNWETAAGVKLEEVDQLLVSLHDNSGAAPRVACVVRLREAPDQATLLSRWGNPSPESQGDAAIYSTKGWSFFIPSDAPGVFLMGSAAEVADVAKNPHGKPLLRREMERLLRASDSERHVSILFAPNFVFFDAQAMFSGDLKRLQGPLQSFLGDGLNAALASAQFGDRFYAEMRLYGTLDREKTQLASEMRDRLAKLPDEIEDYVARLVPHPYWRKLALRFPPMIRFLHQQTRIGAVDDHAVINAALPGIAAPNLFAASELTLVSQPGAAYVAEGGPAKPAVTTIDELLNQKFSISFPQQSLDFAMAEVETEVRDALPDLPFPFAIKLLGTDLQLNGITQNQAIRDFMARDKPLKDILTEMVMKANPITTVKSPDELDQKLIWVVGPDPSDASKNIILITTRDAAGQKGYTLPEAFKPKQ